MDSQLLITSNHPIFKNHKVYGRSLLPGMAYIDLLYQHFNEKGYDYRELELRNLSLYKPFVIDDDYNILLHIHCKKQEDLWQIEVYGQEQRNGDFCCDRKLYITAQMHEVEATSYQETLDIEKIKQAAIQTANIEKTYQKFREQELLHTDFMVATGSIYQTDELVLVDLQVGKDALADAQDLIFHPTLLDASGVGAAELFFPLLQGEERLFLPLFYESFYGYQALQAECITVIKKSSIKLTKELMHQSMEFFDCQGRKVAELKNFVNKLVRNPELINTEHESTVIEQDKSITNTSLAQSNNESDRDKMELFLCALLGEELGKSPENIPIDVGYYQLGLDSAKLLAIVNKIETKMEIPLAPTLLFEYTNIGELAEYLQKHYSGQLESTKSCDPQCKNTQNVFTKTIVQQSKTHKNNENDYRDIAIIGIAGRYPQAENIAQFWENLQLGMDSISEIPKERWDWCSWQDIKSPSGKNLSKWGGFIDDIDKFDPLFFNISPREAEIMDPQERLFLQICWQTIEDAGYTPKSLVMPSGSNKNRHAVGVFVGVMHKDYTLVGKEQFAKENIFPLSLNYAQIANRVSYVCNFHGPSMAIDTVCSSSLTAIHMALQSIRSGESEVALAGGVNLSLHPGKYISYGISDLHSSDGRCRAFGEGGDGYVPAEGVGAILLKPLSKAIADRDHIYAVVKGSSVNHVGTVSGISVPSPVAQSEMIMECLEKNNIHPRTISYIEAHGTGTSLGDPIEIQGLVKAFNHYTCDRQFCSIGSVKSNMGHAEAAAGISGLTKAVLQLHYRTLVPSLHSQELNHHIDFAQSPFYVQQTKQVWEQPTAIENNCKVKYNRRAGVSSFGAGGSNAHIILEEYNNQEKTKNIAPKQPVIIILSAKTQESLQQYVESFLAFISSQYVAKVATTSQDFDLINFAYTLQIGRKALNERLAFVAESLEEIEYKLRMFLDGEQQDIFCGRIKNNRARTKNIASKISTCIEQKQYIKLAKYWIGGETIPWKSLYKTQPYRVSLPTYPFAKERYWVPQNNKVIEAHSSKNTEGIHPLIDQDVSTAQIKKYSKCFDKELYFVKDHIIQNKLILPAVIHLEMALAVSKIFTGNSAIFLQDVVWGVPVILEEDSKDIEIVLNSITTEQLSYSICDSKNKNVYSQGKVGFTAISKSKRIKNFNISAVQQRCFEKKTKAEIYQSLREYGFQYGSRFQLTVELYCSEAEALSKIVIPDNVLDFCDYNIYPCLLDAILRTPFGIFTKNASRELKIPFSLQELEIFAEIPRTCYCYATYDAEKKENNCYNLFVFNEEGIEVLRVKCLSAKSLSPKSKNILYYQPVWKKRNLVDHVSPTSTKAIVVFSNNDGFVQQLTKILNHKVVQVVKGKNFTKYHEYKYAIHPKKSKEYDRLFQQLLLGQKFPEAIIYTWSMFSKQEANNVNGYLTTDLYSVLFSFQAINRITTEKRISFLYCYSIGNELLYRAQESISGFAKSLTPINHLFQITTLQLDQEMQKTTVFANTLKNELRRSNLKNGSEIKYVNQERYERVVEEASIENRVYKQIKIRNDKVYVITGGAGSLGLIFARYLSQNYQTKLLLLGRSVLTKEKQQQIKAMSQNGSQVLYIQADISNKEELDQALKQAKQKFGQINGVIHSAGMGGKVFATEASVEDFKQILAPKLEGTIYLDLLTQDEPLEFFVLFSSISAQIGDFGLGSYAAANRFLDSYALYREGLRRKGMRSGKTISLNWPYWKEGGLQDFSKNEAARRLYFDYAGLDALSTSDGLQIFEKALQIEEPQIIITLGQKDKIDKTFKVVSTTRKLQKTIVVAPQKTPQSSDDLFSQTAKYLLEKLARITKISENKIEIDAEFEIYGIDSVMIMEWNKVLEKDFSDIPGTLFFEHTTIAGVSKYLLKNCYEDLQRLFPQSQDQDISERTTKKVKQRTLPVDSLGIESPKLELFYDKNYASDIPSKVGDIAIIGISGRYPHAENLDEFWQNLTCGRDSIEEIPETRWDIDKYYNSEKQPGKTYSKWGSFIKDVELFDAEFFNISPQQATLLDPQARIFLQTAWHAIEDAGYTKSSICNDSKRKVGVFVGVMWNEYALYSDQQRTALTNNASLANQVSYHFDFHGPSLVIDTACSSSLYTVAMACESIQNGSCSQALVGGVNISIHPNKYIGLSQAGFLAKDGRCRSFGKGGSGYVSGEGVGCLVLKPLTSAIKDKDNIYGVIKGYATNHSGKTNGATIPNPNAQTDLIESALKKAQISPGNISYIETHGTGTEFGDSIEIRALDKVFQKYTERKQYCSIGSIKSNVGHLEGAAGVVAITKVLLQMKYKKLVASLHSQELNPMIRFEKTPFFVQQDCSAWKRPLSKENGIIKEYPRTAGVSSFGATGANAHIIIQEYCAKEQCSNRDAPIVVILSAKTFSQLQQYAQKLLKYTKHHKINLISLAYTLQIGREVMDERLGMVVDSIDDLQTKLLGFMENSSQNFYYACAKNNHDSLRVFSDDEDMEQIVQSWFAKKKYQKILQVWVNGFNIDWNKLYKEKPQRISAPTYPFAQQRYWITDEDILQRPNLPKQQHKQVIHWEVVASENGISKDGVWATKDKIQMFLLQQVALELQQTMSEIPKDLGYYEMGLSSSSIVHIIHNIEAQIKQTLLPTLLFEYPSIEELTSYLYQKYESAFSHLEVRKVQQKIVAEKPKVEVSRWSLSYGQKGLWTLQKMMPEMTSYNIPVCIRVIDRLDLAVLQQAHDFLLEQYPILTSVIKEKDDPYQEITQQKQIFEIYDTSKMSSSETMDFVRKTVKQPFDLENKLLKTYVFSVTETTSIILFVVHHIAFDGSSIMPFVTTLLDAYQSFATNKKPKMRQIAATYNEFVAWEQNVVCGAEGEKRLNYWQQKLSGNLPTLELFADPSRDFVGQTHHQTISISLKKSLEKFAQSQQVYLSTVLLAAFKNLLYNYTNQQDIIVGMAIDQRPNQKFCNTLGYFVNLLPIRSYCSLNDTFIEFTQKLQVTLLEGIANSYPFENLVRQLHIPRHENHTPIFQVLFTYQNFLDAQNLENFGDNYKNTLTVEFVEEIYQYSEYFEFEVFEKQQGILLKIKYNPEFFERSVVESMMKDYILLLERFLDNPQLTLNDYANKKAPDKNMESYTSESLSKEQIHRQIHTWNATEAHYPKEKTIHQLFEEQCERTPNNEAVRDDTISLTYCELDECANQLANVLIKEGVRSNDLVALYLDRTSDILVAFLGVLKAGGAYLPLDPSHPEDRIRFVLEDCETKYVITTRKLAGYKLLSGIDNIIAINNLKNDNFSRPNVKVTPNQLAYCIYTSGSTGKPKGALITHLNVVRLCVNDKMQFSFSEKDVWSMFHSYCFDFSVWESYGALFYGGCVVVVRTEVARDPSLFLQLLIREKITVLNQTPTAFYSLVNEAISQQCPKLSHLRYVIFGGEVLNLLQLGDWKKNYPDVTLVNMFGTTETTVVSTFKEITDEEMQTNTGSIGVPMPTVAIYVLDTELRCLPIGEVGEICIGGDGVGNGYLKREELTHKKFVENPFIPGGKLYRTGDSGKLLPDGEIVYIGRMDTQIQLRGFRIELGEIENLLNQHPALRDNAVIVKEEGTDKQLVVYFVTTSQYKQNFDIQILRDYLGKHVPEYMIPSIFIAIDIMPLNSSGKVDKKELSNRRIVLNRNDEISLPQSQIEEKILQIWKDVLDIDNISTKDVFFEVGGDSLRAIAVAERIKKQLYKDFGVTMLFKYPSIQELCKNVFKVQNEMHIAPQLSIKAKVNANTLEIKNSHKEDNCLHYYDDSLAVIGISCSFPGAKNKEEFWQNLRNGKESGIYFSKEELLKHGIEEHIIDNRNYVPKCLTIDNKDDFDADFFSISPQDAKFMDPQFRQLLTHSWLAIEDAGYKSKDIPSTSVFISASNSLYQAFLRDNLEVKNVMQNYEEYFSWLSAQGGTIPTMISYKLGFVGESVFVHSNCSSALTGLRLAHQSLQSQESKYALIGGATIFPSETMGYVHQSNLNLSSDGHCKAFDANADGMVIGEGVGVIIVKRAIDAIQDQDHIYGIVRGVAVNNDGADKVGFYAPSVKGQSRVIEKALEKTGIDPRSISYVEAHGTGTQLGDSIEFEALCDVYKKYTTAKQFCGIGSVKSNIGHLDSAAGIAGCIKTLLCLYHREIPPSINYKTANPDIHFANSAFYLVDRLTKWENNGLRRAAQSAFGIGGTNAHAIFEEYQTGQRLKSRKITCLIPLSAKSDKSLKQYAQKLLDFIATKKQNLDFVDFAYTLQTGRTEFTDRWIAVANDCDELIQNLQDFIDGKHNSNTFHSQQQTELSNNAHLCEITEYFAKGELNKIAKLWSQGVQIDWSLLYQDKKVQKMSLPTYPFLEQKYSLSENTKNIPSEHHFENEEDSIIEWEFFSPSEIQ